MAIPIVRPPQGGEPPRKKPGSNTSEDSLPPVKMGRTESPRPKAKRSQSAMSPSEEGERARAARPKRRPAPQGSTPVEVTSDSAKTQPRKKAVRPQQRAQGSQTTSLAKPPTGSAGVKKSTSTAKKGQSGATSEPPKTPGRGNWVVDPKTGVRHRALPKTEWDPDSPGYSISHIEDSYDANYDLDSMAKDFLGHLRVAPSKKELAELQREKEAMKRAQDEEYHELHDGEEEEENDFYDDEEDE